MAKNTRNLMAVKFSAFFAVKCAKLKKKRISIHMPIFAVHLQQKRMTPANFVVCVVFSFYSV